MAALPEYVIGGLSWQIAAQGSTDLISAYLVDLANYAAWRITPTAVLPGSTVGARPADGMVIDNMDGVADVYATVGVIVTKIPRYQKSVIPLAFGTTAVVITGAGTPRVYFYAGTFHGQTDNVSFYSVQQMAAQSTITSGSIDAYLQTLRWKFNLQLPAGYSLDNLTDSGFFDVLNPTSPASGNLAAGTYSIIATSYSQSNLYTYQLVRNVLSPDTQVYERRQLAGSGWTPWRNVGLTATGQCQFQYVSPTQCRLVPMGGGLLTINGNQESVPAGLTVANMIGAATLAASTQYYAYAYMNGAAMTLEWSTTAFALDARGLPIKTGDPTRTCVGWCYTDATGKFQDTAQFRCVATYFNRFKRTGFVFSNGIQTVSTGLTAISGCFAFSWGDNATFAFTEGFAINNGAGNQIYSAIAMLLNGAAGGQSQTSQATAGTANFAYNVPVSYGTNLGLGLSNIQILAAVSGGTGTFTKALYVESIQ